MMTILVIDENLERKDLMGSKHMLGIIFNIPKRQQQKSDRSYTILMKNAGNTNKEGKMLDCIPLMNISTFLREWNALHSISNYSLFPLTPYLLQASPAISVSRIK